MSTLTTIIQHSFGSPSLGDQSRKINEILTGKEEVKLSLFADDMILYIGNCKEVARKVLGVISESGKVARYKINAQKSLAFLYTSYERLGREIKKQSHLPLQQK